MNRIIGLLFIAIVPGSCRHAKPATYYIPKNYEGVFALVYDQPTGTDSVHDGRSVFIIPENGILMTKAHFQDGWLDDVFLLNTDSGYIILKNYLPTMDTTGKKFDKTYYEVYSNNANKPLVNFRQNAQPTYNLFDSTGNKTGSCTFQYELITVGRASVLSDSLGKIFIAKLENYLKSNYCR